MTVYQESISVASEGRGTFDITRAVAELVGDSKIRTGLATVFVHHTSASLIVCENADPAVRRDLEHWMARAVPDGDGIYEHVAEGPDDMPAHVRATLTATSLTVPVEGGRLQLGTWQGIYLYEHRSHPHRRRVTGTVVG